MTHLWPVVLRRGPLALRPLNVRDKRAWEAVRSRNAVWLRPWDATLPPGAQDGPTTFRGMVRSLRASARHGSTLPFALDVDGHFRGQVTVGGIHLGSLRGAHIGYWIDQQVAGRGFMPMAVAMATDHCFAAGLHRIEINIRPENRPSIRVVEKLGFRYEGLRERYLHINGEWCDHLSYALTADEVTMPLADAFAATLAGNTRQQIPGDTDLHP